MDRRDVALAIVSTCLVTSLLYIVTKQITVTEKRASKTEEIRNGVEELIGNTPLLRLKTLSRETGCDILGKAEFMNPGQSPKDRVALSVLKMAEEQGHIVPGRGDIVYEGTVGSTGISLAILCCAKGFKAHICMPNDQAREKSDLLSSLGARVERLPPVSIVDKNQFVNKARLRAEEHTRDTNLESRGIFANQFENEANWRVHYASTGAEIYEQTGGKLDAFVAGAGTGGTISGVALQLKPLVPSIKIVLADPEGSGLFNKINHGVMFNNTEREGTRRRHQVDTVVEGIGINRITQNLEAGRALIDEAIKVTDFEAVAMSRYLVEKEGLFLGSSSAVNLVAAIRVAEHLKAERLTLGHDSGAPIRVVTILCDPGTRHLSKFHNNAYLESKGINIGKVSFELGKMYIE